MDAYSFDTDDSKNFPPKSISPLLEVLAQNELVKNIFYPILQL
jgi:hypothetical protein